MTDTPAAEPFRLCIQNALTAALSDVELSGPYPMTLGIDPQHAPEGRVFRGRATYGENDPLPMCSLIEDPRNLEQLAGSGESATTAGEWNLLLQGFVEDDLAHPTDPAYWLLAAVKQKLFEVRAEGARDRNFLGLGNKKPCVEDMKIGSGVVRPPDEISSKAYFWLPLTLKLVEDNANPFTSTQ